MDIRPVKRGHTDTESSDMSNLGLGVMLNMLGGNEETVKTFTESVGKKIASLNLGSDDALHIAFDDGSKIKFFDAGQSCCESRYMRTDDDLSYYVGAVLLGAEIKEAPSITEGYEDHECEFLEIKTDKGVFTMTSHNEHNGYYGGFYIVVRKE